MFASGGALGRMGRAWAAEGRALRLLERAGGSVDAIQGEHVTALVHDGDPVALEMLSELAWWVALGLNNLIMTVDAQIVVIGGGLSEMGTPLIEAVSKRFDEIMVDRAHRPSIRIVQAALGGMAGAIGAALVASDRLG